MTTTIEVAFVEVAFVEVAVIPSEARDPVLVQAGPVSAGR